MRKTKQMSTITNATIKLPPKRKKNETRNKTILIYQYIYENSKNRATQINRYNKTHPHFQNTEQPKNQSS